MFNLKEEQKILAESLDNNLFQSKEVVKSAHIKLINVSALTTETINRNLEKVCEVHDKVKIKSFHESKNHYSD